MTQQRLDRIEDEFETVKQLLASAANYAQSAHEGLDELTRKQDRTQRQLDQLSVKVDDLAIAQDRTQVQLDQLSVKQDRTQEQLDQLSVKLDQTDTRLNEFIFHTQRLFNQQAERMEQAEGRIEQLEAIAVGLDRNFLEFQRTTNATIERLDRNFLEFQRTTNAALERIDRILDYLLRQQQGGS